MDPPPRTAYWDTKKGFGPSTGEDAFGLPPRMTFAIFTLQKPPKRIVGLSGTCLLSANTMQYIHNDSRPAIPNINIAASALAASVARGLETCRMTWLISSVVSQLIRSFSSGVSRRLFSSGTLRASPELSPESSAEVLSRSNELLR